MVNKKFLKKFILTSLLISSIEFILFSQSVVYFSPDDKVADKLINLIKNAQYRIHAAIFMLTNEQIAQALIESKKRGIDIEIITDKSCMQSESNKIEKLKQANIQIFVYKDPDCKPNNNCKFKFEAIMHNKFAVIDNKTWTGSFNWTVMANTKNQENALCTDEKAVNEKYEQQFQELKRRCTESSCKLKQEKQEKKEQEKKYKELEKSYYQNMKKDLTDFFKKIRDYM